MSTRVYLPGSFARLRELAQTGELGVPPVGRAVTAGVRAALADADEEEREYAVLDAAAADSLELLGVDDEPRRVVVVAEVPDVVVTDDQGGLVRPDGPVRIGDVVAVHADAVDAAADVSAARDALAAETPDSQGSADAVDRCRRHGLGWFATQEIDDLLRS